jgi:hypothetical protein
MDSDTCPRGRELSGDGHDDDADQVADRAEPVPQPNAYAYTADPSSPRP